MVFPFAQMLSSAGVFAGRAFLPAFIGALLIRFGGDWAWLQHLGLTRQAMPPWFTYNATIGALGALSGLEFAAHRNSDARRLLAEFDHWTKPVMAGLVTFGLVHADDSKFAATVLGTIPMQQAGFGDGLPALVSAVLTWWGAGIHNSFIRGLHDADPDDDLGLQRFLNWVEELWAGFGIVLLLLFPLLMAGLATLVISALYLLARRARKREDASRVACGRCGGRMYRCAMQCPACNAANPTVLGLTWLGTTARHLAPDREAHPFELVAKKRCPRCASRLPGHTPRQKCAGCGLSPFGDPAFVDQYDRHIAARLPLVLIASLAFSAIPIVGLLPGLILYRLRLVAPFRAYVPRAASMITRWMLRALFFVLVLLHLVPAVGAVTVPLLALANWSAYRRAFLRRVPACTGDSMVPTRVTASTA